MNVKTKEREEQSDGLAGSPKLGANASSEGSPFS